MNIATNDKWVPLKDWAEAKYEKVPHINTLRNWVNNGLISPRPKKMGRGWYVKPNAEYRDN
jgi:hypothetical protein